MIYLINSQDCEGDVEITDDGIYLRAERDGNDKDGRVYTITYIATDESGNEAIASAEVKVPHNWWGRVEDEARKPTFRRRIRRRPLRRR